MNYPNQGKNCLLYTSGLCIVGSVWLRYGALAVAVGAAVAAGRCCKPQTDALRGHCTPSGVVALAAAVCYGLAAVLRVFWICLLYTSRCVEETGRRCC